jgi:hypothetical protein
MTDTSGSSPQKKNDTSQPGISGLDRLDLASKVVDISSKVVQAVVLTVGVYFAIVNLDAIRLQTEERDSERAQATIDVVQPLSESDKILLLLDQMEKDVRNKSFNDVKYKEYFQLTKDVRCAAQKLSVGYKTGLYSEPIISGLFCERYAQTAVMLDVMFQSSVEFFFFPPSDGCDEYQKLDEVCTSEVGKFRDRYGLSP